MGISGRTGRNSREFRAKMRLLDNLNREQKTAVLHPQGPLLVLAGAGSGKTRVLTYRIAYLLRALRVSPRNILAVTFTNKAAAEMRERVFELIGFRDTNLWIGTFHSCCVRILRSESGFLGQSKDFSIYDVEDQLRVVKEVMNELSVRKDLYHPKSLLERIERAKDVLCSAQEYTIQARTEYDRITAAVFSVYQEKLKKYNAFDFGDLILETVRLCKQFPSVLEKYSSRFYHVLVDEYQDTNFAQYVLIKLLSQKHRNLCVVGDEDQSIYSWRGATIRNILEFEQDFPDAEVVKLEENYRSTGIILEAASRVIENNRTRKGKELWTNNSSGPKITLVQAKNNSDEARQVIEKVVFEMSSEARPLNEICILYRTNAQSRVFEEESRKMGIPYVIVGGVKFYERKEVKDIIAYLSILVNPKDNMAFRRVINAPARGLGKETVRRIEKHSEELGTSLLDAVQEPDSLRLSPKREKSITKFTELIAKYVLLKEKLNVHELMKGIVDDTSYLAELEKEGTRDALNRVENVLELLSSAKQFCQTAEDTSVEAWLSTISLFSDIDGWDEKSDVLTLMTTHNAKGLEFPIVFITGLEEGLFPHSQSLYPEEELEEERRLFYVGMTRAKEKLIFSYALQRVRPSGRRYQMPSRFIGEIPRSLIWVERTSIAQEFPGARRPLF